MITVIASGVFRNTPEAHARVTCSLQPIFRKTETQEISGRIYRAPGIVTAVTNKETAPGHFRVEVKATVDDDLPNVADWVLTSWSPASDRPVAA